VLAGLVPARRRKAAWYHVLEIWAISFARSIVTSIKVNEASAGVTEKAWLLLFWPIISHRDLSGSLSKEARYVRLSRRL
jgi:hypothetical protein